MTEHVLLNLQALAILRKIELGATVQLTVSKGSLLDDRFDNGSVVADEDTVKIKQDPPVMAELDIAAAAAAAAAEIAHSPSHAVPRN